MENVNANQKGLTFHCSTGGSCSCCSCSFAGLNPRSWKLWGRRGRSRLEISISSGNFLAVHIGCVSTFWSNSSKLRQLLLDENANANQKGLMFQCSNRSCSSCDCSCWGCWSLWRLHDRQTILTISLLLLLSQCFSKPKIVNGFSSTMMNHSCSSGVFFKAILFRQMFIGNFDVLSTRHHSMKWFVYFGGECSVHSS